jgi:predicted AAA+ superfamily ATPase
MPYLAELKYHKPACQQYLRDLFNSVELKDIVRRNNIRDIDLLERILAYVTVNLGTTFSATTISKYFKSEGRKVSIETILNYLNYCMSAFLFYRVPRQDLIGKKVLAVNEKYYIADHGIKQALYGGNMKDIGLVLENMVYLELIRRGYDVTVGKVGDKEIDFVAQSAEGKLYVQVTYLLASEETITREFNVLKDIDDNYPKYVVSLDEFDMSQDGIKHMNMRDFLLAEKWA